MPGVPRELVEHALNVDPKAKPVKQPLQRFDEPKRKAGWKTQGSSGKSKHRLGYLIQSYSQRKIQMYKEYVSTTHLSTNTVQRIPSLYLALIR
jgi:hypothetical protein